MLLAINIQNSVITMGCFSEEKLCAVTHIAAETHLTAEQYACQINSVLSLCGFSSAQIDGAIMCSVVPKLSSRIPEALMLLSGCKTVNVASGVKTGLNLEVDNPRGLGSDLVCVAVEAAAHGALPALVIDMNTAITFTALDSRGVLVGSAIAPGLHTGLDALRDKAAQLPAISLKRKEPKLAAKNTVEAMASGVLYGAASMTDGMIVRFRKQLGENMTVYLTGADAELIAPLMQEQIKCSENMVLYGLHRIWNRNRRK